MHACMQTVSRKPLSVATALQVRDVRADRPAAVLAPGRPAMRAAGHAAAGGGGGRRGPGDGVQKLVQESATKGPTPIPTEL